jgi:Tfp pilus assembly protein PilF
MALCYLKLHQLPQSDSLSMLALTTYSRLHPKADGGTARLLETLAWSQAAAAQWNTSTALYRRANRILAHQPTAAATSSLTSNRIQMAFNYLGQDSLSQARRLLHTLTFSADDSANRYKAQLYEGLCLYKQSRYRQAGQLLGKNLPYYQAHADTEWTSQVACQLLLARTTLALAAYPQAQTYVATAQVTVLRKLGPDSWENARCVELNAAVSKELGRYSEAARAYAQVTTLFRAGATQEDPAIAGVLAELADLEVTQGDVPAAQRHIAMALSLVAANGIVQLPTQTGLLNTAAYIDYAAGHSAAAWGKYRQTIALNRRFGQARSVTTAAAWNGLGLLALAQRDFQAADSLLTASVALYEALLGPSHPTTATVYLNQGLLRVQQGKLPDAQRLIQQAQQIAEATLPADHDLLGDVAGALGDVAWQQGQRALAQDYYQRARLIYSQKFSPDHWKVRQVQRKLSFAEPEARKPSS